MQPCPRQSHHRCTQALAKEQGGADDWFEAAQLDNYGFSATAKDLDTIEAARPVALWGNDGHTVWVNSRGLALLGRDG
jgi:predicted amidohydrolase YtcJ